MDNTDRNIKIQFSLSQQVQESLRNIREMSKLNAHKVMAQQLEEMRKAATLPIKDVTSKMAEAMQAAKIFNEVNIAEIAQRNENLVHQLVKQQQEFASSVRVNHLDAIVALSQSISKIQPALSVLENLQTISFQDFEEVQAESTQFNELSLSASEENLFLKLFLYFKSLIYELPKGRITANGILQTYSAVISTVLLLYTVSQSKLNEQTSDEIAELNQNQQITNQILENISALGDKIYPLIEDLAQTDQEESIFVTKRESPIRLQPSSKADTLLKIPPNQEVEIIKSEIRWYYVKFYDFKESVPKMGYIYKGNVIRAEY